MWLIVTDRRWRRHIGRGSLIGSHTRFYVGEWWGRRENTGHIFRRNIILRVAKHRYVMRSQLAHDYPRNPIGPGPWFGNTSADL